MRAFGYSLPTAIADLVDNSISAGARNVEVEFDWEGPASVIRVADDGRGMDEKALIEAMRLGSRSPLEVRSADDLGRFGLGLKSAAWSQARSLTVVSRALGASPVARRWDLDYVTETRRWSLLDGSEGASAQAERWFAGRPSGAIVVLESLDRLVGPQPPDDEAARGRFLASVAGVDRHLAMVFHRFLAGRNAVSIKVNGRAVEPWDPFLESHPATQRLPTEILAVASARVEVHPFVLPHVSKLSADEHRRAAGPSGWNAHQGFYVYRGRRLLVAGGWLGLPRMQREEHNKLARIRVDLDNSLDELWQIDVRKATARIPGVLQPDFRRIAESTRARAADVYRYRGKTVARSGERQTGLRFVWERVRQREGAHVFRVNRKHPVLAAMSDQPDAVRAAVERALRLVEENLPVEAIVLESRERPEIEARTPFSDDPAGVGRMLREAHSAMVRAGTEPVLALAALAAAEPFDAFPEIVQALREEIGP